MIAALALLGAVPAVAQTASAAPAAISPAVREAAYALAQQLRTRESVLAEVGRLYESSALDQLRDNPQIAELEKTYPGIWRHLANAARPEVERQTIKALPQLWSALADIYASELTLAEMAQVRAFFASPAGERFRASLISNYDFRKEIAPLVKDVQADLSADDMRAGIMGGIPATLEAMSPADKGALMAFARTSAFAKVQKVGPRVLAATAAWANRRDPADEARLEKVIEGAADRYIGARSAPPKKRR